jgi:hypothetical protein
MRHSHAFTQTVDRCSRSNDEVFSHPAQAATLLLLTVCAGTYAPNEYSNKRWCCGDMDHFDVSVWAFEKLADQKWGVIGIKYRQGES